MESSWRRNVADFGLGPGMAYPNTGFFAHFTLSSRMHGGVYEGLYLCNSVAPSGILYFQPPVGLQIYGIGRLPGPDPGHPHFPYGYNVDPDVHA